MIAVTQRVCRRAHNVHNVSLNVTALEAQPDVDVCAIQVSGILSRHTHDVLELYFENNKRSGGGPVDDELVIDYDEGTAVITFSSSQSMNLTDFCGLFL